MSTLHATDWINRLQANVRGLVTSEGTIFNNTIALFDNSLPTSAQAVVLVLDAKDVSSVVSFARSNALSVSVKSGGYNTAGWAVQGDIIIDLCTLDHIQVHTPDSDGQVRVLPLERTLPLPTAESNSNPGNKKRKESLMTTTTNEEEREDDDPDQHNITPLDDRGKHSKCKRELDGERLINSLNPTSTSPTGASPPGASSFARETQSPNRLLTRYNSDSSSTTTNDMRSGQSGGDLSEATGETSAGPSRASIGSQQEDVRMKSAKGKEPAVESSEDERIDSKGRNDRSRSRDSTATDGTRSWVANQARDDTSAIMAEARTNGAFSAGSSSASSSSGRLPLPRRASGLPYEAPLYHYNSEHSSYATSFRERASPAAMIMDTPPFFNFSALDPSNSSPPLSNAFNFSGGANSIPSLGGISSAGFVFNTAALASNSTIARSSTLPLASPALASSSSSTSIPTSRIQPVATTSTLPRVVPTTSSSRTNSTSPLSINSSLPSMSSLPYALVTIGTGAKSKQIDQATSQFSYHVPLAAYPVGCAIFASGGFGFMSRLHGLSMDNVVEAEMVLPDGRIIYLREMSEQPPLGETEEDREMRELWWAFRGAGTTMGIITRVRAKAFQTGLVYSGNLIYPFNPITTPSLMKHWRDCCKNAPRELYMNLILTAGPTPAQHVVVIQICYIGSRTEGDEILQSMMSWSGEVCLLKDVETRTFMTQQDSVVQVLSAQNGNRWCIRADLMNSLPDEAIHKTVAAFTNIPERSAWLFEIAAGAIADPLSSSSCFPTSHRSAPFQVAAIHQWANASDDFVWTNAAIRWIADVISPHSPGSSYPCFLAKDTRSTVAKAFGAENWNRLVEMKARLDPMNLLRHTFWPSEQSDEGICGMGRG